jgi:Methylmalonyl-CoA mutase
MMYPGLASWAKFSRPSGTKLVSPGSHTRSKALNGSATYGTAEPVPFARQSVSQLLGRPASPRKLPLQRLTQRFREMEPHFYEAKDLPGFDPERELGEPGEFPFTRGIRPSMYRSRLWTMRQYSGMGDAEQSNRRYQFLLPRAPTDSRSRSTCLPRSAVTPTPPGRPARWAGPG